MLRATAEIGIHFVLIHIHYINSPQNVCQLQYIAFDLHNNIALRNAEIYYCHPNQELICVRVSELPPCQNYPGLLYPLTAVPPIHGHVPFQWNKTSRSREAMSPWLCELRCNYYYFMPYLEIPPDDTTIVRICQNIPSLPPKNMHMRANIITYPMARRGVRCKIHRGEFKAMNSPTVGR